MWVGASTDSKSKNQNVGPWVGSQVSHPLWDTLPISVLGGSKRKHNLRMPPGGVAWESI